VTRDRVDAAVRVLSGSALWLAARPGHTALLQWADGHTETIVSHPAG
jgi:hypothetical protein